MRYCSDSLVVARLRCSQLLSKAPTTAKAQQLPAGALVANRRHDWVLAEMKLRAVAWQGMFRSTAAPAGLLLL